MFATQYHPKLLCQRLESCPSSDGLSPRRFRGFWALLSLTASPIYSTEYLLISLSPLVLMAILLKYPPKNKRTIWQYYTWQLLLSHFSFFLGLMIGLIFWRPPNDLLPEEGVVQPFAYYWTIVIYPATLILCSVYVYHWHKHTTRNEINAIGSKEP